MPATLHAGAARRTINPPLGIGKIGGRLFGDPIHAIESDLTAARARVHERLDGVPPRTEDHPDGGWQLDGSYALPDQLPQFYPHQITALHPDSEQRALEATVALIDRLV